MKTGMQVADVMVQRPVTVPPTLTILEAAKIMAKRRIGSVIVRDQDQLVGLVTEEDVVRRGVARNRLTKNTTVGEIMTRGVVFTFPGKDIFDALGLMRDYNVRHLPVMDEHELVGIVTTKDILAVQNDLFDILEDRLAMVKREPED